jgi:hypothetical protein
VLDYRYADTRGQTQNLTVTVVNLSTSKVEYQSSLSGPITTTRGQIPFSQINYSQDSAYRVEYSADRGTAGIFDGTRAVGDIPEIADEWNIDPRILEIFGFIFIFAMFGATVILSPRHAGLVASVVAMGLNVIGVVSINSILLGFGFVVSGLFAAGGRR